MFCVPLFDADLMLECPFRVSITTCTNTIVRAGLQQEMVLKKHKIFYDFNFNSRGIIKVFNEGQWHIKILKHTFQCLTLQSKCLTDCVRDDPSEHSDQAPVETGERRACLLSVESSSWYVTTVPTLSISSYSQTVQSQLTSPGGPLLLVTTGQAQTEILFRYERFRSEIRQSSDQGGEEVRQERSEQD